MSNTQDRLKKYFTNYAKKLMLDFEAVLDNHPGELGDNREKEIEIFLRQHLPPIYQVNRGGKVIDSSGRESKQADIIICNAFVPRLRTDQNTLYFVEGVMSVIECKSVLSKEKLRNCVESCREMKKLNKIFEGQNEVCWHPEYTHKLHKVHFSVLAYDSPSIDTVVKNLLSLNKELNIDINYEIDCICVIKKGVIFKPAFPTFEGCVIPGRKSFAFKELEFESLAYFLIQLQKEVNYINYINFDLKKYWPNFLENWLLYSD